MSASHPRVSVGNEICLNSRLHMAQISFWSRAIGADLLQHWDQIDDRGIANTFRKQVSSRQSFRFHEEYHWPPRSCVLPTNIPRASPMESTPSSSPEDSSHHYARGKRHRSLHRQSHLLHPASFPSFQGALLIFCFSRYAQSVKTFVTNIDKRLYSGGRADMTRIRNWGYRKTSCIAHVNCTTAGITAPSKCRRADPCGWLGFRALSP